jgi:hypothetical protein
MMKSLEGLFSCVVAELSDQVASGLEEGSLRVAHCGLQSSPDISEQYRKWLALNCANCGRFSRQ